VQVGMASVTSRSLDTQPLQVNLVLGIPQSSLSTTGSGGRRFCCLGVAFYEDVDDGAWSGLRADRPDVSVHGTHASRHGSVLPHE
jgi:hypothetical protein